jgi:hypothetical protein
MAIPRTSFRCQYTLLTPLVEGAGRVSKSAATVATFWLTLAKVGGGVSSWLMVAEMTQARARALVKSMVAARFIPSAVLCRCISVI